VDLTQRKITIRAEDMKANADLVIPIHPEVAEVLTKMLQELGKIDPTAPVLGLKLKEITRSFKSALKKAELPDMRWHDLRHTAGTWWAERTTEAIRKRLMGHAPKDVTDLYTHIHFETLKGVVDSMPRIVQPEIESRQKIAAEA
jgi:integrase